MLELGVKTGKAGLKMTSTGNTAEVARGHECFHTGYSRRAIGKEKQKHYFG